MHIKSDIAHSTVALRRSVFALMSGGRWIAGGRKIAAVLAVSGIAAFAVPARAQMTTCQQPTSIVNERYIVGWLHNNPARGFRQDGYWRTAPNGAITYWAQGLAGADVSVVNGQGADETVGSGLTRTATTETDIRLDGANQATFAAAKADNDYVQYQFSTVASFSEPLRLNRFGWGINRGSPQYPYQMAVELADNAAFANPLLLVQDTPSGTALPGYTWHSANFTTQMFLRPATTYYVRLYVYGRTGSTPTVATLDDFQLGVSSGCADYGDAPASYGQPAHALAIIADSGNPLVQLGAANVDGSENGPLPSAGANGDDLNDADDENGATVPATMTGGTAYSIPVTAVSTGLLNAWIDWNRDGDFGDAGEQIASNQAVAAGASTTLTGTVPTTVAGGQSYVRLRYCAAVGAGCNTPGGLSDFGEVEDYTTRLIALPQLTLVKITFGGIGAFAIAGNNGMTAQTLTTTAEGAAATGTAQMLNAGSLSADTVFSETLPAGWQLRDVVCTGLASGSTPTFTAAGVVTLPFAGLQSDANGREVSCTLRNVLPSDLSITKHNADPTGGRVVRGATTRYTVTVANAGPGSSTNPIVRDTPSAGLNCAAANPVTCTGPAGACPAAAATVGDLTGAAGLTLGTLAVGTSLSLQFDCVVQ